MTYPKPAVRIVHHTYREQFIPRIDARQAGSCIPQYAGRQLRSQFLFVAVSFIIAKTIFWPLYFWLDQRSMNHHSDAPRYWWPLSFLYFYCVCVLFVSGLHFVKRRRLQVVFSGDLLIAAFLISASVTQDYQLRPQLLALGLGYWPFLFRAAALLEFVRAAMREWRE